MARPALVSTASVPASSAISTDSTSRIRRRSSTSASTPAGSETKRTGSRLAACTAEVRAAACGWCTSIHCAPTVCIQVPTLEPICAIHSTRNVGTAIGAQADEAR